MIGEALLVRIAIRAIRKLIKRHVQDAELQGLAITFAGKLVVDLVGLFKRPITPEFAQFLGVQNSLQNDLGMDPLKAFYEARRRTGRPV